MSHYAKNLLIFAAFTLGFILIAATAAQATCLPPLNPNLSPKIVASENARGCWVGWWCPDKSYYIAAATKNQCSLVSSRKAAAAWVSNPDVNALKFGLDPITDPTLRAVWEPEKDKLLAIRPPIVTD